MDECCETCGKELNSKDNIYVFKVIEITGVEQGYRNNEETIEEIVLCEECRKAIEIIPKRGDKNKNFEDMNLSDWITGAGQDYDN